MAEVKWIKITTDIFDDEKILLIESMPDADAIIVIWFKLLVLAGRTNNCGVLTINDTMPYNDEMLSTIFRRPLATVRLALQVFENFGMIETINDTITIPKWEVHQNIEGMEKIREQTRKRVARYREKQKLLDGDVALCNATVTEQNRIDKNKNRKENNIYVQEFERLWELYPKKQGKKKACEYYIKTRNNDTTYEEVEKGIIAYAKYIKATKTEDRYIKQGSTFFSQQAWQDEWGVKNGTDFRAGDKERSGMAGRTGDSETSGFKFTHSV